MCFDNNTGYVIIFMKVKATKINTYRNGTNGWKNHLDDINNDDCTIQFGMYTYMFLLINTLTVNKTDFSEIDACYCT